MPILRLRRIGKRLGVIFPSDFIAARGLRPNDLVHVEADKVPPIEAVRGSIRHLGLSVDELNAATNEGENV